MRFILRKHSRKRLFIEIGIALFILTALSLFLYLRMAQGVTRTWDGEGTEGTCPGNANGWSCSQNWSSDTVPGASDIAAFDNTSDKDATIDASFGGSVAGVDINSGYDGTITQARSLTVGSSHFDQASGTWTGGSQNITANGNFTVSGGSFSGTGTLILDDIGNLITQTLSCSGTFPMTVDVRFDGWNTGTFVLDAGCEATLIASDYIQGNATINGTLNATSFSIGMNLTVNGTVNSTGTLTLNDLGNAITQTLACSGTFPMTVDTQFDGWNTGTFDLDTGCETTLANGDYIQGNLNIDGTLNANSFSIGRSVTVNGTLNSTGTLTLNDLADNITQTVTCTGTFPMSIDVTFDGWNNGTFNLSSNCVATMVNSAIAEGNITNNGTLNATSLSVWKNFTNNGNISMVGPISFVGSSTTHDSIVSCSGTFGANISPAKTSSGANVTLNTGCSTTLDDATDTAGGIIINGTAAIDNGTGINVEEGFDSSGGTLTGTGTVTMDGGSATDDGTFDCNGTFSGVLVVSKASGGDATIASGCSVTLGDATDTDGSILNSGSIDIPGGTTVNVEENFGSSGGTLTGTGTVVMDGTSATDDGTFACNGSFPGSLVITKSSGGDATIGSGCTVTLGDSTDTSGSIINNGTLNISSSQDINIEENFLSSSGTVNNSGTIILDGTSASDDSNLSCNGSIGNLTINKTSSGSDTTLTSSCTVANFTRTDGPLLNPASPYILTITGNLSTSTSDNFGGANLTINFSGTNAQNITRNTTTISTPLTVNKTSSSVTQLSAITIPSLTITDGEFTNSTLALTVSGTMSISDTFTQGSGTVTADTITVNNSGRFQTSSTGDLVVGSGGVSNSGVITIGTQNSCPATNNIDITSSTPGTRRSWTGSGSTRMYDVNVTDQGGTADVVTFSSTSVGGNGDNWYFISGCTLETRAGNGLRLGSGARLR